MDGPSLQFQGGAHAAWLAALLLALVAVLLAHAAWQLLVRRHARSALLSLSAVLGPVVAGPALAIDALVRRHRGDPRGARLSLLAAAACGALLAAGAGLYALDPTPTALWSVLALWYVVLAVGVFYAAAFAYLGARRLAGLLVLRVLAVLALIALLVKPAVSVPPPDGGRGLVLPVLVDRSGSMSVADSPAAPGRYLQAVHALRGQAARIETHLRPAWHHFGSRLQSVRTVDDLAALEAAGEGTDTTNLAVALRSAAGAHRRADLAGILLLSDGNHLAPDDLPGAAAEAGVPVYAIGVGGAHAPAAGVRNARVAAVEAPLEVVRDNRATITARVQAIGLANQPLRVRLLQGERELDAQTLVPGGGDVTEPVALTFLPGDENAPADATDDVRRLTVAVDALEGEVSADDNLAAVHVLVIEPRVRVLYVESIRPEYRFLSQQLRQDPNVQLVTLVRIAERTFAAQGQVTGRALTGLPAVPGDLEPFDVVVLGDIDRIAWTDAQLRLLADFVRRGGGLLMLGGQASFGPGGYGGSPLEEALPVLCGPREIGQEGTEFVPQMTADGQVSPLLAGLETFFAGPDRPDPPADVPPLTGCVRTVGLRPGATALLVHPTRRSPAGPLIVLAVQDAGEGRAVAFTADTTWRWHLWAQGRQQENPHVRFWRQMVRYLADVRTKDKPAQPGVLARMERTHLEAGQGVRLLARVQDASGLTAAASVTASLRPEDQAGAGEPAALSLQPTPAEGLFEAELRPERAGRYVLRVAATDPAGQALATDELPVTVADRRVEMERLARDEATLRGLAEQTGGLYGELLALPDVIDRIIDRSRGRADAPPPARIVRLYDFTAGFIVFTGLITTEWLLRRRWQLQ